MPMRHLSLQGYKLGKSQSDILILSPRYIFPTTSSNALYTYPKLIIGGQIYKNLCIHMEGSERRNNTLCACGGAIFFLGLDFQTAGTNFQTFGGFSGVSYTDTQFHDIFRLKLILFNIANVLDIYQPIIAYKGDKMRFSTFMLIE